MPLGAPQDAPPVEPHAQVEPVSEAGRLSAMVAPVAVDGPAFVTVMVYVTGEPGWRR